MIVNNSSSSSYDSASDVNTGTGGPDNNDKKPSKKDCTQALKFFEQFERLFSKINNRPLDIVRVTKLKRLISNGTASYYDFSASIRDKMSAS